MTMDREPEGHPPHFATWKPDLVVEPGISSDEDDDLEEAVHRTKVFFSGFQRPQGQRFGQRTPFLRSQRSFGRSSPNKGFYNGVNNVSRSSYWTETGPKTELRRIAGNSVDLPIVAPMNAPPEDKTIILQQTKNKIKDSGTGDWANKAQLLAQRFIAPAPNALNESKIKLAKLYDWTSDVFTYGQADPIDWTFQASTFQNLRTLRYLGLEIKVNPKRMNSKDLDIPGLPEERSIVAYLKLPLNDAQDSVNPLLTRQDMATGESIMKALAKHKLPVVLGRAHRDFSLDTAVFEAALRNIFGECEFFTIAAIVARDYIGKAIQTDISKRLRDCRMIYWVGGKQIVKDMGTQRQDFMRLVAELDPLEPFPTNLPNVAFHCISQELRLEMQHEGYEPPSIAGSNSEQMKQLAEFHQKALEAERKILQTTSLVRKVTGRQVSTPPNTFLASLPHYYTGEGEHTFDTKEDEWSSEQDIAHAYAMFSLAEKSMRVASGETAPRECWGCGGMPKYAGKQFHRYALCPHKGDPAVREAAEKHIRNLPRKRKQQSPYGPAREGPRPDRLSNQDRKQVTFDPQLPPPRQKTYLGRTFGQQTEADLLEEFGITQEKNSVIPCNMVTCNRATKARGSSKASEQQMAPKKNKDPRRQNQKYKLPPTKSKEDTIQQGKIDKDPEDIEPEAPQEIPNKDVLTSKNTLMRANTSGKVSKDALEEADFHRSALKAVRALCQLKHQEYKGGSTTKLHTEANIQNTRLTKANPKEEYYDESEAFNGPKAPASVSHEYEGLILEEPMSKDTAQGPLSNKSPQIQNQQINKGESQMPEGWRLDYVEYTYTLDPPQKDTNKNDSQMKLTIPAKARTHSAKMKIHLPCFMAKIQQSVSSKDTAILHENDETSESGTPASNEDHEEMTTDRNKDTAKASSSALDQGQHGEHLCLGNMEMDMLQDAEISLDVLQTLEEWTSDKSDEDKTSSKASDKSEDSFLEKETELTRAEIEDLVHKARIQVETRDIYLLHGTNLQKGTECVIPIIADRSGTRAIIVPFRQKGQTVAKLIDYAMEGKLGIKFTTRKETEFFLDCLRHDGPLQDDDTKTFWVHCDNMLVKYDSPRLEELQDMWDLEMEALRGEIFMENTTSIRICAVADIKNDPEAYREPLTPLHYFKFAYERAIFDAAIDIRREEQFHPNDDKENFEETVPVVSDIVYPGWTAHNTVWDWAYAYQQPWFPPYSKSSHSEPVYNMACPHCQSPPDYTVTWEGFQPSMESDRIPTPSANLKTGQEADETVELPTPIHAMEIPDLQLLRAIKKARSSRNRLATKDLTEFLMARAAQKVQSIPPLSATVSLAAHLIEQSCEEQDVMQAEKDMNKLGIEPIQADLRLKRYWDAKRQRHIDPRARFAWPESSSDPHEWERQMLKEGISRYDVEMAVVDQHPSTSITYEAVKEAQAIREWDRAKTALEGRKAILRDIGCSSEEAITIMEDFRQDIHHCLESSRKPFQEVKGSDSMSCYFDQNEEWWDPAECDFAYNNDVMGLHTPPASLFSTEHQLRVQNQNLMTLLEQSEAARHELSQALCATTDNWLQAMSGQVYQSLDIDRAYTRQYQDEMDSHASYETTEASSVPTEYRGDITNWTQEETSQCMCFQCTGMNINGIQCPFDARTDFCWYDPDDEATSSELDKDEEDDRSYDSIESLNTLDRIVEDKLGLKYRLEKALQTAHDRALCQSAEALLEALKEPPPKFDTWAFASERVDKLLARSNQPPKDTIIDWTVKANEEELASNRPTDDNRYIKPLIGIQGYKQLIDQQAARMIQELCWWNPDEIKDPKGPSRYSRTEDEYMQDLQCPRPNNTKADNLIEDNLQLRLVPTDLPSNFWRVAFRAAPSEQEVTAIQNFILDTMDASRKIPTPNPYTAKQVAQTNKILRMSILESIQEKCGDRQENQRPLQRLQQLALLAEHNAKEIHRSIDARARQLMLEGINKDQENTSAPQAETDNQKLHRIPFFKKRLAIEQALQEPLQISHLWRWNKDTETIVKGDNPETEEADPQIMDSKLTEWCLYDTDSDDDTPMSGLCNRSQCSTPNDMEFERAISQIAEHYKGEQTLEQYERNFWQQPYQCRDRVPTPFNPPQVIRAFPITRRAATNTAGATQLPPPPPVPRRQPPRKPAPPPLPDFTTPTKDKEPTSKQTPTPMSVEQEEDKIIWRNDEEEPSNKAYAEASNMLENRRKRIAQEYLQYKQQEMQTLLLSQDAWAVKKGTRPLLPIMVRVATPENDTKFLRFFAIVDTGSAKSFILTKAMSTTAEANEAYNAFATDASKQAMHIPLFKILGTSWTRTVNKILTVDVAFGHHATPSQLGEDSTLAQVALLHGVGNQVGPQFLLGTDFMQKTGMQIIYDVDKPLKSTEWEYRAKLFAHRYVTIKGVYPKRPLLRDPESQTTPSQIPTCPVSHLARKTEAKIPQRPQPDQRAFLPRAHLKKEDSSEEDTNFQQSGDLVWNPFKRFEMEYNYRSQDQKMYEAATTALEPTTTPSRDQSEGVKESQMTQWPISNKRKRQPTTQTETIRVYGSDSEPEEHGKNACTTKAQVFTIFPAPAKEHTQQDTTKIEVALSVPPDFDVRDKASLKVRFSTALLPAMTQTVDTTIRLTGLNHEKGKHLLIVPKQRFKGTQPSRVHRSTTCENPIIVTGASLRQEDQQTYRLQLQLETAPGPMRQLQYGTVMANAVIGSKALVSPIDDDEEEVDKTQPGNKGSCCTRKACRARAMMGMVATRSCKAWPQRKLLPVALSARLPHIRIPIGPKGQSESWSQMPSMCGLLDTGSGLTIGRLSYWMDVKDKYPELIAEFGQMAEDVEEHIQVGGIEQESKGSTVTCSHYISVITPFRANGEPVNINIALTPDLACNLIFGIPFIIKAKLTVSMWEKYAVSPVFNTTFKVEYIEPRSRDTVVTQDGPMLSLLTQPQQQKPQ